MKKAISPLMATIILVAITLAVSALLGSWFTSMTKTETEIIEKGAKQIINCSNALLDIVDVICSNTSQELKISINNIGQLELYSFSVFAKINNTFYTNNTGGPNKTHPLNPGEQAILAYHCSRTTYCAGGASVGKVRVSPMNCPQSWMETDAGVTCG